MPILLEDKNRDFQRLRHTSKEKAQLAKSGFQHVLSSNVSSIARQGKDLLIRFHGGATYIYPGQAKLYRPMLQSNSKGRFVWQRLIRPGVPYKKVGTISLVGDEKFTDKDLVELSQTRKERETVTAVKGLIAVASLQDLGIITSNNIVNNIIATNAI